MLRHLTLQKIAFHLPTDHKQVFIYSAFKLQLMDDNFGGYYNFTGEKYTKKSVLLKSQIIFTMLYFHINHCNNSVLTRMSSDTD